MAQANVQVAKAPVAKVAPASKSLLATKAKNQDALEAQS
jgi:hypothetical protein